MCFEPDARPPDLPPPMAGGAADGRSTILEASDGNRFRAYAAAPSGPTARAGFAPGTGMVVIPDIRGLVPYYEELALRFAEAGMAAAAVDLYARSAGTGERGADFDYREASASTTQSGMAADVAAAVRFLRSDEMGASRGIFTVGFCFGGRASLLQAVEDHGLAGVIAFYGWPVGTSQNDTPAPADVAGAFGCPVLALYGGADRGIPAEAIEAFDRALERAGIEHESVTYPGAPHSFFDRHQEEYAGASVDAWARMVDFVGRHAGP
jgi:carboxymethylenebutenolidase